MNPFDRKRGRTGAANAAHPDVVRRPATPSVSRPEEDDARSSSKYRAALEALFAKKGEPKADAVAEPERAPERTSVKMVTVPTRDDPRRAERDKRMAKVLAAEGRAAVTKAVDDFVAAGFPLPEEQEVMLKLLDHANDDRVRVALETLARLLDAEAPQRRPLLDARLRRLEDDADDSDVRSLAASLRKKLLAAPRAGR